MLNVAEWKPWYIYNIIHLVCAREGKNPNPFCVLHSDVGLVLGKFRLFFLKEA